MPKTYKNEGERVILGIEPGQTGSLDDEVAHGFVGPGALSVTRPKPSEDALVAPPKPPRGDLDAAE